MAVTIEIQQRTADLLRAQAEARGLSLDDFLRRVADDGQRSAAPSVGADAVRDFDAALEELFASDPRKLPPLDSAYSREDIYLDHD